MSTLQVIQGETFTKWVGLLSNPDGWIDLSTATQIKMVGKIEQGVTLLGPVVVTATAAQAFTANLSSGSNILTSVSAFTGITEGSTITGLGISPSLALVGSMDVTGNTITMVDPAGNPVNATKTATTESLTANRGMTSYTALTADTANAGVFDCEFYVHFPSGVLIVPNDPAKRPTLTINAALDLAGE